LTANQPTSPSRKAAIRAEGLTKRFGTLTAVDHLTLTVPPGEAFALVGPDAAGKTTTMRMLVSIMDPDEGRAKVLGFDTVKESEALKEQIGYMPQRLERLGHPGGAAEQVEAGAGPRGGGQRGQGGHQAPLRPQVLDHPCLIILA